MKAFRENSIDGDAIEVTSVCLFVYLVHGIDVNLNNILYESNFMQQNQQEFEIVVQLVLLFQKLFSLQVPINCDYY